MKLGCEEAKRRRKNGGEAAVPVREKTQRRMGKNKGILVQLHGWGVELKQNMKWGVETMFLLTGD